MLRDARFLVLGFIVFAGVALAQQDPLVGTWKLNVASSKTGVGTTQLPRTMVRTVVAQGSGYKISYEGEGSDGSRIAYSYVTNFDGKDVPISGMGQPKGADIIAITRRDARSTSAELKQAGKAVATEQGALSTNGKMEVVSSGGYPSPGSTLAVYQKQ